MNGDYKVLVHSLSDIPVVRMNLDDAAGIASYTYLASVKNIKQEINKKPELPTNANQLFTIAKKVLAMESGREPSNTQVFYILGKMNDDNVINCDIKILREHIGQEEHEQQNQGYGGDNSAAVQCDDVDYCDAVRVVVAARKASASLLQRSLRIGYGKAARIMEEMEERGVIGPQDGSHPREVLIDHI